MTRPTIKLGVPFALSVNNAREHEFIVSNFHDAPFDSLLCKITNTTSYPPPKAYETDATNAVIRIEFDNKIPTGSKLELLVQGAIAQKTIIEEKKVLLSDEKIEAGTQALKKAPSTLAKMIFWCLFAPFVAGSLFLYLIKDSDIGKVLSRVNAAEGARALANFDPRIHTNKHSVYKNAEFMTDNAEYKKKYGDDLSDLYNYVGDIVDDIGNATGVFVLKDVVRDKKGNPIIATWSEADSRCEEMGGLLLDREFQLTYLAQQYFGRDNFLWPIKRNSDIREWASDKYGGIFFFKTYWMFLKEKGENPTKMTPENMFVVAKGNETAAIRCIFFEDFYPEPE